MSRRLATPAWERVVTAIDHPPGWVPQSWAPDVWYADRVRAAIDEAAYVIADHALRNGDQTDETTACDLLRDVTNHLASLGAHPGRVIHAADCNAVEVRVQEVRKWLAEHGEKRK